MDRRTSSADILVQGEQVIESVNGSSVGRPPAFHLRQVLFELRLETRQDLRLRGSILDRTPPRVDGEREQKGCETAI